jgi:hypothetical protein
MTKTPWQIGDHYYTPSITFNISGTTTRRNFPHQHTLQEAETILKQASQEYTEKICLEITKHQITQLDPHGEVSSSKFILNIKQPI